LSTATKSGSLLKDTNLYVIFGITLTAVMGVTTIAPALPSISHAFEVTPARIGLLITFFTLPGIFLTPLLGLLADRYGRKVILVPSLFIFGIAGTACAFSVSFNQLLFFRVLQGFGSAALGALNLTLIGDLYTGNRRASAMGYNASVLSIGTAVYPAVGGALAIAGWFYPFFLSLLAIPVGLFVLYSLDPMADSDDTKMKEIFGKVLISLKSLKVLALFAGMFLTFIMLYGGYITFFTILLDEKFGLSPFYIGILLSSSSLITSYTAAKLGKLTLRFSEVKLIRTASFLYLFVFLAIPQVENVWWFLLPVSVFGLAQGINIPSILNLLTGEATKEHRAAFLSVNWMVMRIAQALGPYLLGLIYLGFSLQGTFYFSAMAAAIFILVNISILKESS